MVIRIVNKILSQLGYNIVKIDQKKHDIEQSVINKGKLVVQQISPSYKVLNGPLKDLKYPSLDITEAALVPKIVGSYESQLHPILNKIINSSYSDIIDVGCAEGYYAVGLARMMPHAVIHGFDINENDILFCKKMIKCNNINNITLNNYCSPETLINFDFRAKGLVFCDCEGYELQLFSPEVIKSLSDKNVDVLVELHDVLIPGISSDLILRFKETYDIRIVSTKDKSKESWLGLETLSEEDKAFAVFEHRGGVNKDVYMEWAFFTKKRK